MKLWLPIAGLTWLTLASARAQVTVDVTLDQEQFLPSEAMPAAVRIVNNSGQPLHLGATSNWLTFDVESQDGFLVPKLSDVPLQGNFDLAPAEMETIHVDLQPYFALSKSGRYTITANLRIKQWNQALSSGERTFDIIHGAELWSENFGLPPRPGSTNGVPEVRRYALEKANYLRSQLRLYVQVSDAAQQQFYKVSAIGPMVSFSDPQAELDRASNLHVLCQSGAQTFTYVLVDPNGKITHRDTYDYIGSRPRLSMDDQGDVTVIGGVRRPKESELPMVKPPNEVGVPAHP
jgi:hypothetical protein